MTGDLVFALLALAGIILPLLLAWALLAWLVARAGPARRPGKPHPQRPPTPEQPR